MGCSSTNNKDDTGNNKTRYEHNNAITSAVENGCAIEGEEGVGHSNSNNTNNNNNNGNNNGNVYNHINNARSNSKKVIINKLSPSLVLTNIHNKDVFFFTQLHSKQYILGFRDGTLALTLITPQTKSHLHPQLYPNSHSQGISYICDLYPFPNTFATCSLDSNIKIWCISPDNSTLTNTHTIEHAHDGMVNKLIQSHSHDKLLSCSSQDPYIHVWSTKTYEHITSITSPATIWNVIHLQKDKNMFISSCYEKENICIWNINTYEHIADINNIACYCLEGMLELPNGNVACICDNESIVIINIYTRQIVKTITTAVNNESNNAYITGYGSLCLFDKYSFIYCCKGNFLQIANDAEYEPTYQCKLDENEFDGDASLLTVENGLYIVSENGSYGLTFLSY